MTNKKDINFVITDLDDTIWDWLAMWSKSFKPYFEAIKNKFDIDENKLKNDFKAIHQKYGTTEASYIYNELTTLSFEQKKEIDKKSILGKSILHNYYSNKKNNLKIYDGVLETLKEIKNCGAYIVGFTESNAFFTKYRIKHLGLDGIFDCIYTPKGYEIPDNVNQVYDENHWEPEFTEIRYLPRNTKKPNHEILDVIIADFKADKKSTIYIGDKLDRDILMAQEANVISVHAKYGHVINSIEYDLLRDVTHWTDEDVEREKKNADLHADTPDYILNRSYAELKLHFNFTDFTGLPNRKQIDQVLKVWDKVISVQMHFNDIELRIRNYALTLFTFIIAAMGFLEKEKPYLNYKDVSIPTASVIGIVGSLALLCFYFMDKFWYHRLLSGAGRTATKIENKWGKILPELSLSSDIYKASPFKFLWIIKTRSNGKYRIFYFPLIIVLLSISITLWFIKT